jgi:RND family efflux transporter MFP subunit
MKKRVATILTAFVAVAIILFSYGRSSRAGRRPSPESAAAADGAARTEAPLFLVERKPLTDSIENLVGTIKGSTIELTFNGQEERLQTVHVTLGQKVQRGDCLFELEHTKAKARLAQARSSYDRAKELHEAGGATQRDADDARAILDMAQKDYDDTFIYAPKRGQVSQINRQEGETVGRNDIIGVLVSSEDRLVMETGVIEGQLDRVIAGQPAQIQIDALGSEKIKGKVAGVSREVSTTGRTGTVIVELPEALQGRLRPGLSARCDILTLNRPALVIPRQAYDSDKKGVFVVTPEGKANFRAVEIGYVTRDYYEAASGLKEGDRVVADLTSTRVQDGASVAQTGELARYEAVASTSTKTL